MTSRTKKILYGLGALAAVGIVWSVAANRGPKIEYDTVEARKGTLSQTVEVSGEVISFADVALRFETAGRIRTITAKVGAEVQTGDILATLDDREARVRVQSAQASLLSARAELDRLQKGATAEDIRVSEVAVANAEISLQQAKQALADAEASAAASLSKAYGDLTGALEATYLKASGAMQTLKNDVYDAVGNLRSDISPSNFALQTESAAAFIAGRSALVRMDAEIVELRATSDRSRIDALSSSFLEAARTVRNAAQLANALMQSSNAIGSTTQAAFEARRANVRAAWTDLNAGVTSGETQKFLISTTAASGAASVNAASQSVRVSEGALESAKALLALKKAPATAFEIDAARAHVASAAASLGESELALDKTRIRAPFDGSVAQVTGRVGTTVTSADAVIQMHGEDVFEVEADVPETDIAKLKIGLKARMTLDAYGDDTLFEGELVSIDSAQTVLQDVVYYKARFRFVARELPIRTGMTASATVVAVERTDVIIIPQRAVREDEDGAKYVRVLENGAEARRDVQIGLRGDDGLLEVASGLSGGEQVIVSIRENGTVKR